MRLLPLAILLTAASLQTASVSAMGRSEDPRDAVPPPAGTDADPDIRQTDERLRQLLAQPGGSTGSNRAPDDRMPLPPAADPADRR